MASHQHFVSLWSVVQPVWGRTRWRWWVKGMKFARRKQFFSILNLPLSTSSHNQRTMWPATKRTLDLLPSTSPDQSFCTDRKNLHCHFSYGPITAETRLDFRVCSYDSHFQKHPLMFAAFTLFVLLINVSFKWLKAVWSLLKLFCFGIEVWTKLQYWITHIHEVLTMLEVKKIYTHWM